MEPSRGRGRGRGKPWTPRGRGRGHASGRQQAETPGAAQPQRSQRGRGQRTQPQTPFTGGAYGTSRQHSQQEGTGAREKRRERAVQPEELGFQFETKLGLSSSFPPRPGVGDLGKRIRLLSTCFSVKVPSGNVYHYDVDIIEKRRNPKREAGVPQDDKKYRCLNTKKNREIIRLLLNTNPLFGESYAAYDGRKNMYTRYPLRADFPVKYEVILPDENVDPENPPSDPRQDAFEVQINPVKKFDTESCAISLDVLHALYEKRTNSVPPETIMALETVLRDGPCLRYTPVGRSFFYPPDPQNLHPLGGGVEIWFGYHQSLRLGQWGPMVNLNLSATTFYQQGPVLNYIAEFLNTTVDGLRRMTRIPDAQIKRMSSKLKDLRIKVNHERNYRRKYRILKLDYRNANQVTFDVTEDGRTVKRTIAAYFRERYNRDLRFPNLPCLRVHPERANRYLPVEVCDVIEGQHCKKKLEPKQTAEMIKFTALPPSDRFAEIKGIARDADFNSDSCVQEFGIEVDQEPLGLEGRVLPPPKLIYNGEKVITPRDGSWNMRQTKFLRGAEVESWVLLSFARVREHDLYAFSDLLLNIGRDMGLSLKRPKLVDIIDPFRCDVKTVLSAMKKEYDAALAVIVVPSNDKSIYGKIKQTAETSVGLATQCIAERNVSDRRKCSPKLVANLCLKINAKMGGENNSLLRNEIAPIMTRPVIIIGADVNHPGPSRGIKPSLAACVGSLDEKLSRYAVSIRVQPNVDENKKAVEIITDLKGMVLDLLRAFHRHTRKKPEKIYFYRDGVSEGQFDQVQKKEVSAIRKACQELGADYQPGITFIVVQKRHQVRFFPDDPRDGVGAMKNIPPGTTVDTVATHPVNFDYFLCSHAGIKGTSRPSHYMVLEDDNGFTANQIQRLTYQLCHTYARCTRSISIPVPVAYADLAAYRARLHLEASTEQSSASSDISDPDDIQQLPQSVIQAVKVIPGLGNAMYFV